MTYWLKRHFFLTNSHLSPSLDVNPFEFVDNLSAILESLRPIGRWRFHDPHDPSLHHLDTVPTRDGQTDGHPDNS